ncbi:hypothetical protein DN730_08060 [Marinomonas piezotolerans]|uniref:Uncharacterized protein n=1 Tax=Marinomonas piezotolerans TaxID=2213058 RepID=A0A370U9C5_9GAMM|nr:hypothetical protein [Marinomonas piezotolerans]RDL44348.1 hypothetical protein DN730_08060 [Marinomonas piezotolerans]
MYDNNENIVMRALFNQQRIQILTLGIENNYFTDSYLYAWESGVYPYLDDSDGSVLPKPHECYEEYFQITRDIVSEVLEFIYNSFKDDKSITFYELEENYGGQWDARYGRETLLSICRYAYLKGHFHSKVWEGLLTQFEHPSEASAIVRIMDRDNDIYIM